MFVIEDEVPYDGAEQAIPYLPGLAGLLGYADKRDRDLIAASTVRPSHEPEVHLSKGIRYAVVES